jgi:hypothetical protein
MLYLCFDQSIQENEDDVDIGVGPAPEISDLLGSEYEHLYPKILYLVMADSAYCEGTVSFTSKLLYPQKYRYKTCRVQNMSQHGTKYSFMATRMSMGSMALIEIVKIISIAHSRL